MTKKGEWYWSSVERSEKRTGPVMELRGTVMGQ